MADFDSAAQGRRLRTELKRLRVTQGKTQREVALALDWSASKLIRIEGGGVNVSQTDLKALLEHYDVHDHAVVDELVQLAKGSKQQPWGHYKNLLTPETIQYLGYVSAASEIRQFQPSLMPGLLQVEDYTRAQMIGVFGRDLDDAEDYVRFRQEYRQIMTRRGAPAISIVLDEAVVSRAVGGVQVMEEQFERLQEVSTLPNVDVRVIPFAAGANPGMRGPFTHLSFADAALDDLVYVENTLGENIYRDDPETCLRYRERFDELEGIACTPEELPDLLARILDRMKGEAKGA
jgi:transcriptional regulator with XRE-family HTH domain